MQRRVRGGPWSLGAHFQEMGTGGVIQGERGAEKTNKQKEIHENQKVNFLEVDSN